MRHSRRGGHCVYIVRGCDLHRRHSARLLIVSRRGWMNDDTMSTALPQSVHCSPAFIYLGSTRPGGVVTFLQDTDDHGILYLVTMGYLLFLIMWCCLSYLCSGCHFKLSAQRSLISTRLENLTYITPQRRNLSPLLSQVEHIENPLLCATCLRVKYFRKVQDMASVCLALTPRIA